MTADLPIQASKPFLKWAGGKSSILPYLRRLTPKTWSGTYREPFLGGGAFFFGICQAHRPVHLSDTNAHLIAAYLAVRDHVEELILELQRYVYEESFYYATRAAFNAEPDAPLVTRAARMIYLNRVCVNGLFRVNQDGHFNVSFGRYSNPRICHAQRLRLDSTALQGSTITRGPWEANTARAKPGDLIYLDPPYIPFPGQKSFTAYQGEGFTHPPHEAPAQASMFQEEKTDHERLADECRRLDRLGASVVLSNSDTPLTRRLYAAPGWEVTPLNVARSIGAGADRREDAPELIISNLRMPT